MTTTIKATLQTEEVGPRFTPVLVAAGMALLSIMQLVLSIIKLGKERAKNNLLIDKAESTHSAGKTGFFVFLLEKRGHHFVWLVMLVCSLAMTQIGFILSAIIIMFVTMYVMCPGSQQNIPVFLASSIGIPIIVYFVFVKFFFLMLPAGNLWKNLGIL
jgi:hypothetical protein